ncbi:MAG: SDR family oxidoreductase [Gammaproteobacteria bacterium]|nr:SDR family oxidoreductase [Gammaproteobacteria bacterium]
MKLSDARVLLTGAGGGIGSAIAAELLERGAAVLLVDVDGNALQALATGRFAGAGDRVGICAANLTVPADRDRLCAAARGWRGGINVLINNAGVSHFGLFEEQQPAGIDLALAVNVQAPLHLCRALLDHLQQQPEAHILNTGSVFGSIGYPAYAVYSATKFAIRGFTEALRRELDGSNVHVHYLAPRATRTGINTAAVERMNAELGVATDDVATVAAAACRMIESDQPDRVLGWPEKVFARLNGAFPRLVDQGIRRQLAVIRRYARTPSAALDDKLPASTTTPLMATRINR